MSDTAWLLVFVLGGALIWGITNSRGARLALAAALVSGCTISFDKLATLSSSPMFYTGSAFLAVALYSLAFSVGKGEWQGHDKSAFGVLFLLGLVIGLMTVLMNEAYYYGPASYVASLKRTQIMWTVLFACSFLGEKFLGWRLTASAIVFAGVTMMAF